MIADEEGEDLLPHERANRAGTAPARALPAALPRLPEPSPANFQGKLTWDWGSSLWE